MNADEKLAAAGLTDVDPIDHAEFDRLPAHKREVRTVFVRLPDPAPVVALREVARITALAEEPPMTDPAAALEHIGKVARAALAEFDGTTT